MASNAAPDGAAQADWQNGSEALIFFVIPPSLHPCYPIIL